MLYLGADHNGYFLKEKLKRFLSKKRFVWKDCGSYWYEKADDYVDFSNAVTRPMRPGDLGLLVCGSGHGMVIAANKVSGIRAIMPLNPASARDGRHDDHANVLVLAARAMTETDARRITTAFLTARLGTAERYLRRLRKVKRLER